MKKIQQQISSWLNFFPVHFLVLFGISFLAYSSSFPGDFLGDDVSRIVAFDFDLKSRSTSYAYQPPLQNGLVDTVKEILPDRPFLMFTIWLHTLVPGPPNALIFKIVNLLIHCLNALLLGLIVQYWARRKEIVASMSLVFFIELVFLLHPMHVQTINILIQRGTLLACTAILLCSLLWLRWLESRRRDDYLLIIFVLLCGTFSKQFAILTPFLMAAFSWNLYRNVQWKRLLPLFAVGIFPSLFYFVFQDSNHQIEIDTLGPFSYFIVQWRVVADYLLKFFYPLDLAYQYPISRNANIFDIASLLALSIHLIVLLSYWIVPQSFRRYYIFLFLTYLAFLAESGFFPIWHLVFDHRVYFPYLWLSTFMVFMFQEFLRRSLTLKFEKFFLVALALFVAFLALRTYQFNRHHKNLREWSNYSFNKFPGDLRFNRGYLFYLFVTQNYHDLNTAIAQIDATNDPTLIEPFQAVLRAATPNNQLSLASLEKSLADPNKYPLKTNARQLLNSYLGSYYRQVDSESEFTARMERLERGQIPIYLANAKEFRREIAGYLRLAIHQIQNYAKKDIPLTDSEKIELFAIVMTLSNHFQYSPETIFEKFNFPEHIRKEYKNYAR